MCCSFPDTQFVFDSLSSLLVSLSIHSLYSAEPRDGVWLLLSSFPSLTPPFVIVDCSGVWFVYGRLWIGLHVWVWMCVCIFVNGFWMRSQLLTIGLSYLYFVFGFHIACSCFNQHKVTSTLDWPTAYPTVPLLRRFTNTVTGTGHNNNQLLVVYCFIQHIISICCYHLLLLFFDCVSYTIV